MITNRDLRMGARLLASCVLLAACGIRVDYAPLNPPPHELRPRAAERVDVFVRTDPPWRHVIVGTIDARRQVHADTSESDVVAKIRETAGRHGCDAIKLLGRGADGYRAICIVYERPPPSAPVPGSSLSGTAL